MYTKEVLLLPKLLQRYKALLPSDAETASTPAADYRQDQKNTAVVLQIHSMHGMDKASLLLLYAVQWADAIQAAVIRSRNFSHPGVLWTFFWRVSLTNSFQMSKWVCITLLQS